MSDRQNSNEKLDTVLEAEVIPTAGASNVNSSNAGNSRNSEGDLRGVWTSRNGKPNYYWTYDRGDFRCDLTFIPVGKWILTRLAKPLAKYTVLRRNDFGTKPIGYLVHGRSAKRIRAEADARQKIADVIRARRHATARKKARERQEAIAKAALAKVGILPALFAVNREAKRCRDRAKAAWALGDHQEAGTSASRKRMLYEIKGQALEWLIRDGMLRVAGYHRFPGGNFAEVLAAEGYRFHRPCENPGPDHAVEHIGEIESKPPGIDEVEEVTAVNAVHGFLWDRAEVELFKWGYRVPCESDDDNENIW